MATAGAHFAVLATNTMHKVLPAIESPIPVLSIIDVVADYCRSNTVKTIALTGTRFTMSDGFYSRELESRDLEVIIPSMSQQDQIHRIIYEELIAGLVTADSINAFAQIGQDLSARGAKCILLGCTELVMLVEKNSAGLNTLDSTRLHAEAAWRRATGG